MLAQNAVTSIINDNVDDVMMKMMVMMTMTMMMMMMMMIISSSLKKNHTWLAKIWSKLLLMPLFLTMLWLSGSPKWKQLIISNNYSWI